MRNYWRLVEKHRATTLSAVPTALAALANVPLDGADISSIRYCRTGASPLPPELAARFERQFGLHVHESFGMTEMAGISTITPPGVHGPAGCVGFRLPYSELRIVALDERGGASERDLPRGEPGMVLFRSPNVFSGFLDPADDAQAFTADGWLATGDLGWLDDEERLQPERPLEGPDHPQRPQHRPEADRGRARRASRRAAVRGGRRARRLRRRAAGAVRDAACPAPRRPRKNCAPSPPRRVDEAPARPKSVTIVEHMPMTNVGKIYKPELRLMAARSVVAALVGEVCREAGSPDAGRQPPQVEIDAARQAVVVTVQARAADDPQADELRGRLRSALARLPCLTQVR